MRHPQTGSSPAFNPTARLRFPTAQGKHGAPAPLRRVRGHASRARHAQPARRKSLRKGCRRHHKHERIHTDQRRVRVAPLRGGYHGDIGWLRWVRLTGYVGENRQSMAICPEDSPLSGPHPDISAARPAIHNDRPERTQPHQGMIPVLLPMSHRLVRHHYGVVQCLYPCGALQVFVRCCPVRRQSRRDHLHHAK